MISIKKTILILLLISTTIIGCTSPSSASSSNQDLHINLELYENSIYQNEPFSFYLELENLGNYTLNQKELEQTKISFNGISENSITFSQTNNCFPVCRLSKITNENQLETSLYEPLFENANYIGNLPRNKTTKLSLELEYPYQKRILGTYCYGYSTDSGCYPGKLNYNEGEGVVGVNIELNNTKRSTFLVLTFSNQGKGEFVKNEIEEVTLNFNLLPKEEITCSGLKTSNSQDKVYSGKVRIKEDGTGKVVCNAPTPQQGNSFEKEFIITTKYKYKIETIKKITFLREGEYNPEIVENNRREELLNSENQEQSESENQ